ncbi:hypothetical protein J7M28_13275 [bacterium]|nr:hypothetical protein [bacterium]
MRSQHDTFILENIPMVLEDQGCCSLILSLQAALKYLGIPLDYDYLMGMSGAGFMFYADENSETSLWCEAQRHAQIAHVGDAVGFDTHTICCDKSLFDMDPEGHFYRIFGAEVAKSLKIGRPILAFGCLGNPEWEIIAGLENGRLLCRSMRNPQSGSGLADHIQPYEVNTSWPVMMITIGDIRERLNDLEAIARAIKKAIDMTLSSRRISNNESRADAAGLSIMGPDAFALWAKRLADKPTARAILGHQRVLKTLLDARISLKRFLRWVGLQQNAKHTPAVKSIENCFQETVDVLMSVDLSHEAMADSDSRQKVVQEIESLRAIEASAFMALEDLHKSL